MSAATEVASALGVGLAAFGIGLAVALTGAALARLELRVAMKGFLKRFPDYRLVSDKITFMDRTASRRPTGVPVMTH